MERDDDTPAADPLEGLLPLNEALKLIPSPRTGKPLHVCSAYRRIAAGTLKAVRIAGYYYVRLEDLRAAVQPVRPARRPELRDPPAKPAAPEIPPAAERALRSLRAKGYAV